MVTLAHGTTLSTFPSAREIAAQIRRKEVSPVEVAQAHLDRIERLNPKLNVKYMTGSKLFADYSPAWYDALRKVGLPEE